MNELLLHWDKDMFIWVNHGLSNPLLDILCPIIRKKETWIPLYCFVAYFTYKKFGKHALLWYGLAIVTIICTDQVAHLFKQLLQRPRPCNEASLLPSLVLRAENCNSSFSFISAHAANHFGQAFIYHRIFKNTLASLGFFIWASAIAFAQVYVGVHYPFDVLVGALVGVGIGLFLVLLWQKIWLKL